ncbi:MAG: phytanoyl-CoA dioxygenase family protein [Gammaproteobacteria bacterium]|nr:phytanoyl-CoA dioxygenase family protein [Gammaproteobacteria bacterium]
MLTESDKAQFLEDGYLVIPGLVPEKMCQDVIYAIINYLALDMDRPDSWYQQPLEGHGIVPLHHAQSLWNLRQYPAIHRVFAHLYGDERLWVSMDRVSYKPPASIKTKDWKTAPLHWDCDPWTFNKLGIQGLVYLTDTEADQGAFCCVPSIYKDRQTYLARHKGNDLARYPRVADEDIVAVSGPVGSLVLFHRLMPHSSLPNRSGKHRFVQYVAMQPVGDEDHRRARVTNWQENRPPLWAIKQKLTSQQIPEPGVAAALTSLGRKLVGVDSW